MQKAYSPMTGISDNFEFLFRLTGLELPRIKTNKKVVYYNIPSAFDTEVSSFYNNGDKQSVMYAWGFGIYNLVTVGRTWEQFKNLLEAVKKILLQNDEKLIIYIHNFAYEFQFMRTLFEWDKVFFLEERKPVYAVWGQYEFRCSLKLSGKKLALLGDDLQRYPIHKLEGDLDYNKLRLTGTELTGKEWGYIENDVRVVLHYIQECIENDGGIDRIPLTKTGYVRNFCRKNCMKRFKRYRALMSELTMDANEYRQAKRAFAGGFTHANAHYVRHIMKNVSSFDFISSYPYVMLSEKFPMSKAKKIEKIESREHFEYLLNEFCCMFDLKLTNIRPKVGFENPMSFSKCWDVSNAMLNNGRIVSADELMTTVTEQDYRIYEHFYEWDHEDIYNLRIYEKQYLPKSFAMSILKLYMDKTQLKGIKGREVDYMLSKNMLNACYGMTVTDIVRELIEYEDDEFITTSPDIEKAIDKYNKNIKRFLFYPWGVWVTAYARANLFSGILEFGDDYVYSDTDSIKVMNAENHMGYIKWYNELAQRKLREAAEHWRINPAQFSPVNRKGERKPLGVWDYEGKYDRFKTLGAKRYLVQEGDNYVLTVAGVNKQMALNYMIKQFKDPFAGFDENLRIPPEDTGKNVLTYIDHPVSGVIQDYTGKVFEYYEATGIHMEATDYNLSMTARFIAYLKGVQENAW